MDQIDEDIISKAASGDIAAFEQIYRAYASFVYNVAYRMSASAEDAQEITQEVFLIVHKKLRGFEARSSLKTWIYRITFNYALNFKSKESKQRKGRVEFEDALEFTPDENFNPTEGLEREDERNKVNQMLNLLKPDERACMVLRFMQDLSYEEIAQSLNMNLNTVRTHLKRAKEKLLKAGRKVHDAL